jgi:hypothetical protein
MTRLLAFADFSAGGLALALLVPPERAVWFAAFLPAWILIAKLVGLYESDQPATRLLPLDETPSIVGWGVIGAVATSVLGSLTPAGALDTAELISVAAVAIGLDFLFRILARSISRAPTAPKPS